MSLSSPTAQTLPAGEADAVQRRHIVSALVVDRPGTLNRVSGLLRARSFNIESLTVGTTHEPGKSRMTIAVRGDDGHLRQVLAQLERLLEVLEVTDLTASAHIELELALVELEPPRTSVEKHALTAILTAAGGETVSTHHDMWRARLTASPDRIDHALKMLRGLGLRSLVRAGAVAMATHPANPNETRSSENGATTA